MRIVAVARRRGLLVYGIQAAKDGESSINKKRDPVREALCEL